MVETILPAVLTTGLVGLVAAVVLVVVSRVFHVEEDPLVEEVNELLPGANCGGCGYAGCKAFAEALVKTRDTGLSCPVCDAAATEAIGKVLGMEMAAGGTLVAALRCQGTDAQVTEIARYEGVTDCSAAVLLYSGHTSCSYGCLGLGSCVQACPFDAIRVRPDGIVEVDEATCTGCGNCVPVCPKNLLTLVPVGHRVFVACNNTDKGGQTRKACKVGCIGCKKCVKACGYDAIHVNQFVASVDPEPCTRCGDCIEVCPNDCILEVNADAKAQPSQSEEDAA